MMVKKKISEHQIHIEIEQLDNAFVLSLFDSLGSASGDHKLCLGDMDLVLDAIRNWCARLGLIEYKKKAKPT
jgi:hypothetical protein